MGNLRSRNPGNRAPRLACLCWARLLLVCFALVLSTRVQAQTATATSLMLPDGIAFDAQGGVYVAEARAHRVQRIDPSGAVSVVAGTGVQGFGGDGGPASAALLDSPTGIALDAGGNLYIADSRNHRVRRVDAVSGLISTIAGSGTTGFAGDGGAAAAASLDLPVALAFDKAGQLYIADARSHRVRRVSANGVIATVAGNGMQGLGGDLGPATAASLDSPAGLAMDASGNLFIADSHNRRLRRVDAATQIITTVAGTTGLSLPRGVTVDGSGNPYVSDLRDQRVRRIDAATGAITTVAGEGTQLFAGDGSAAVAASLDSPRGVALSPTGLVTLADSADQRVRQVDAAGIIHTIGGIGGLASSALALTAPASTVYGTGTLTATLTSSPATGSVTFFDTLGGVNSTLGTATLTGNAASFSVAAVPAGEHLISAAYGGDALHAPATSATVAMLVTPAPTTAAPQSVAMLYGQAVPALGGSLAGVLPQDTGRVAAVFSSGASQFALPGVYPISANLTGSAAGNYSLTQIPASITIGQAPSVAALTLSTGSAPLGAAVGIAVHVASSTAGTPTGAVRLFDAGLPIATMTLGATGDAALAISSLATGAHTLTAVYAGDTNFLGSSSLPVVETIGAAATPDFILAASGATSQTVTGGAAAVFSFVATPVASQGVTLASPITLSVSGLPVGATASFSPALLPPGSGTSAFTLTVQTAKVALLRGPGAGVLVVALLLPVCFGRLRRRGFAGIALILLLAGCGARVKTAGGSSTTSNLVVTGTATGATGAVIVHSVGVTLVVQ